eukprot:gene2459-3169_t
MINPFEFEKNLEPPPPNYIPGAGRGASGFTTSGDLGSIGLGSDETSNNLKRPREAEKDYSDSNFDKWSGFNESNLFSSTNDIDDKEADRIWDLVEKKMDRRKNHREKIEKELEKKNEQPKIQAQFADLKTQLGTVSFEEWDSIPTVGDYTIKKRKFDTYQPVPDSLLEKAMKENEKFTTIDSNDDSKMINLSSVHEAKENMLTGKLKKFEESISGVKTVNPQSFLSSMTSIKTLNTDEIGDVKKLRSILKAVTTSNPTNGAAWISAARVEEFAGKLSFARNIMTKAIENCPKEEDIWLEAARLSTPENAKAILAKAVSHVPESVNIWLTAANLEKEKKAKKKVLRKALELIPNSVQMWKEAIELEDEENARIMLVRATECIPHNTELWLTLARLETYANAKKVLNKAGKLNPTDPTIWIAAAELEEENGSKNVEMIIQKAIKSLNTVNITIDRQQWIEYAKNSENGQHEKTCSAIIRNTIGAGIEENDREHTWIKDAKELQKSNHIKTAKAIYSHALSLFPNNENIWKYAIELSSNDSEEMFGLLEKAVEYCFESEDLWIKYVKEKWKLNQLDEGRKILSKAFGKIGKSEKIWLLAVELEIGQKEFNKARELLKKSRTVCNTSRVWMKSAILERNLKNQKEEKSLLEKGIELFPNDPKLWMMKGQLEERLGNIKEAQKIYLDGIKLNQQSIPLWICGIKLEEKLNNITRARALLEKSRQKNPNIDLLWLYSVRLESNQGLNEIANSLIAAGLKEFPHSGLLWSESILLESRQKQKARAALALNACDKDPIVFTTLSRMFWRDRKLEQAKIWFERSLKLDDKYGDCWAYYFKFTLLNGKTEDEESILNRCIKANPTKGDIWISVSKDPKNFELTTKEILYLVSSKINNEF